MQPAFLFPLMIFYEVNKLKKLAAAIFLIFLSTLSSPAHAGLNQSYWTSDIKTVKAYSINDLYQDSFGDNVIVDGKLSSTAQPKEGVSLNVEQIERFKKAVFNHKPPNRRVGMCFYPHHGFVFYNENDEIIGHLTVCFVCSNYRLVLHGGNAGVRTVNYEELETLLQEAKIPTR